MWILNFLRNFFGSFLDFGNGMEWLSIYSPIWSVVILIAAVTGAVIVPLPPLWFVVVTGPVVLLLGYRAGDTLHKKIYGGPVGKSVMEEMNSLLPYNQLQAVILSVWVAYGVVIYRITQGS